MLTTPIPPCIPPDYRGELAGQQVNIQRLPAPIRRALSTAERIPIPDHAERYRIVTEPPHTGPWRNSLSPHTVKIMETFQLPWVREVWYCGVDQSGKTSTALNCLHWAVDVDPGNVFYLLPTEELSDKVMSEKIIPMLQNSRKLKSMTAPINSPDTTIRRVRLAHGVTIRAAHANSAGSMATFAAKYCFCDEVDKYPRRVGQESDPISLIRRRNRQYRGRFKRFFCSTPAQQYIYQGMMDCQQVWEMHHRCPHCGQIFRPEAACLSIPHGLRPEQVTPDTGITYHCTACGAEITDSQRWLLLSDPAWVCVKGERTKRPVSVGFHHRAWDCRDTPLYEIAQAWLAAQYGDVVERVAWYNGYEAEDYVYEYDQRPEAALFALVDDQRPECVVPGNNAVQCLVAGSDTQDNGHYYWIDAVGYGLEQPRWRIKAGFIETDEALLNILFETLYTDAAGNQYPLALCVKDAMGHRTRAVYDMCLRYPGRMVAYKGTGRRRNSPHTRTYPDRYPGTNTPLSGVSLYVCDSHFYKDIAAAKLAIHRDDPGAWQFDSNFTREQAAHLCAEYRDERDLWQCPPRKANHYWDSAVLSIIASELLQCKFTPRPQDIIPTPDAPRPVATRVQQLPPRPARNPYTGGRRLFPATS